jgi:C1A family cysteine protease
MKFLVVLASIASVVIASDSFLTHEFKTCSDQDHLRITSVSFSEELVKPGSTLEVTINGQPDVEVSKKAQAQVDLRIMGVKLYSETVDLCSEFEVSCPLEAGKPFTAKMNYQVPSEVPSVTMDMSVKVFDQGPNGIKSDISCFKTEVRVSRSSENKDFGSKQIILGKKDLLTESLINPKDLLTREIFFRFLFKLWVREHQVEIDSFEKRLEIFTTNLMDILEHNSNPDKTFTKRMNHFGHLTREEFSQFLGYNPVKRVPRQIGPAVKSRRLSDLPESVDWVSKGAVTPVKNQGMCGSCWSFSATGAIEGAYFLKTGKLVSFSEQQLVSCDKESFGCKGGTMDSAFQWAEDHKGMCSDEDYPYISENGIEPDDCRTCKIVSGSSVTNFVDVPVNSEMDLMSAVAQQPISVAIEADQSAFQFYESGVLTGRCGANLDHGVLVTSYGVSEDGIDYWRIKNSWGSGWGEDGYIRIQRGKRTISGGGECGILKDASYPILV